MVEQEKKEKSLREMSQQELDQYFKDFHFVMNMRQESLRKTIQMCADTRQQATETIQSIDKFKDDFGQALKSLAQQAGGLKENDGIIKENNNESNSTPTCIAKLLSEKSRPVFLTGAGISVASGMPTFRGNGGIWTQKNENYDPKSVCTYDFFKNKNELYWEWNNQFLSKIRQCKPNENHHSIAKLQLFLQKKQDENKKVTLITSNIDGYHIDALEQIQQKDGINKEEFQYKQKANRTYGLSDDVFEIHGNMHYYRCQQNLNQCDQLYDMPHDIASESFQVPKCPVCNANGRPHVLFFDEQYDENHYRRDTVQNSVQKCDILFVIGTMLETNLSSNIVRNCAKNKIPIVEINPIPIINYENIYLLKNKSENVLPQIIEEYFLLQQDNNQQSNLITAVQQNQTIQKNNIEQISSQQQQLKESINKSQNTQKNNSKKIEQTQNQQKSIKNAQQSKNISKIQNQNKPKKKM